MYYMLEHASLDDPGRAVVRHMAAKAQLRNMSFKDRDTIRVMLYDAFTWDTGDEMDMKLHLMLDADNELGFGRKAA